MTDTVEIHLKNTGQKKHVPIASGRHVNVIQQGASEGMAELMRLLVE